MATKPIRLVTKNITPNGANYVLLDDGVAMGKSTLEAAVSAVANDLVSDAIDGLDLGTASQSAVEDFATAAQGTKADTAVQPGDLSTVATSGDYDDLSNKPTLGSAAGADTGDFATASQGTKADSAVQPTDTSTAEMEFVLDEDDFASNSDTKLATQGSIKAYVDNRTGYWAQDFGILTTNSASLNTTRINAAIAELASMGGRRTLIFGSGTYNFNGPIVISNDRITIAGQGWINTLLSNAVPDQSGIVFAPADRTGGSGNSLTAGGLRDIQITRPNENATAGYAIEFCRSNGFVMHSVFFSRHANGVLIEGCQDYLMDRIRGFGRFSGPLIEETAIFRFVEAPLDGGGYAPCWQGHLSNFDVSGTGVVHDVFDIHNADGLSIVNGYCNFGKRSLLKIEPTSSKISGAAFSNVYFDGGGPQQPMASKYCVYVPERDNAYVAGTIEIGSGCFVGNAVEAITYVRGQCRLAFRSVRGYSGWPGDGAAPLADIDHSEAEIYVSDASIGNARGGGFNVKNAKMVSIIGGSALDVRSNAFLKLGTAVDNVIVKGISVESVSGAVDLTDTATGNRVYIGNVSLTGQTTPLTTGAVLPESAKIMFGAVGSFGYAHVDRRWGLVTSGNPALRVTSNTAGSAGIELFRQGGTSWAVRATTYPKLQFEQYDSSGTLVGTPLAVSSSGVNFGTSIAFSMDGTTVIDAQRRIVSSGGQYSAADIANVAHAVNTTGKVLGLEVWDTTNNRKMRASGSTAAANWYCVDGSVTVTPA